MKSYVLLDHDGVLVDTEKWYFEAGRRALDDIGVVLDRDQYVADMALGLGTWARAREAGVSDAGVDRQRVVRDAYYQENLRTEDIAIDGVVDALAELAQHVRMAIVTTSKRSDFELSWHGSARIRTRRWSSRTRPADYARPRRPGSTAPPCTTSSRRGRTSPGPHTASGRWGRSWL